MSTSEEELIRIVTGCKSSHFVAAARGQWRRVQMHLCVFKHYCMRFKGLNGFTSHQSKKIKLLDEPDVATNVKSTVSGNKVVPTIKEEPDLPGCNLFDLFSLNLNRPLPEERAILSAEAPFHNSDFATIFGGNCQTVRSGQQTAIPGMFIREDSNMFLSEVDGTAQEAVPGEPILIFGGSDRIINPINLLLRTEQSCPIFVKRGLNNWLWMGMYKVAIQRAARPGEFKAARPACQDIFLNLLGHHARSVQETKKSYLRDDFGIDVEGITVARELYERITSNLNAEGVAEAPTFMQVFEFDSTSGVEFDLVLERQRRRLHK